MELFRNLRIIGSEDEKVIPEAQDNIRLILIYSILAMLACFAYSINSLVQKTYLFSIITFAAGLVTLGTLIYILKTGRNRIPLLVMVISFGIVLFILYATGGVYGTGYIFCFLYPILSLLFFGSRRGTILTTFLLILVILSNFLPKGMLLSPDYPIRLQTRALVVYVFLYFFTLGYSYFNERLIVKLTDALEEGNVSKRSKDQFISSLSHQIRTPLNNIVVLGNILTESKLGEKQADLIDTLVASANNLVAIVDNIAKISSFEKTEEGKGELIFNLQGSIENTADFLTRRDNRKINMSFSITDKVPKNVRGNPIRLKQILLDIFETISLLKGSMDYSANISIDTEEEDEHEMKILFAIRHEELLDLAVAEPGRQEEKETKKGEFALARKLIHESKGEFRVRQNQEGTVISFLLPFHKIPEIKEIIEKDTTLTRIRKTLAGKPIELKDSNVLLVEDNLINQKIVILSLKKFVRNVDVASNGKEALDKFGTSKYDLILMDIQMPTMDGLVATRKIRELEQSTESHIPIIAITANALLGDKETCLSAGMDDYISKPFQIVDLVYKMGSLLSGNTDTLSPSA
jgi:CheY-like chemotaxis protein/signal transduction histidine kinase